MSKILKLSVLLLAFLTITVSTTFAQKYGHLNSGNILSSLPEVKAADSSMETFQKQKMGQYQDKIKVFQEKLAKVQKDIAEGKLTPIQQQQKEAEFQKEQEAIMKFEQQIQTDVAKKREDLLKPILEKVDNAIKAVGKENGYQFIFDTSAGALLYAVDSDDVAPLVKAKLGL